MGTFGHIHAKTVDNTSSPGETVAAGGFQICNDLEGLISVLSVTITVSEHDLFESITTSSGQSSASSSAVDFTNVFTFQPPFSLDGRGGAEICALFDVTGRLHDNFTHHDEPPLVQAGILSPGVGRLDALALPILLVILIGRARWRLPLVVLVVIAAGAMPPGCGSGGRITSQQQLTQVVGTTHGETLGVDGVPVVIGQVSVE